MKDTKKIDGKNLLCVFLSENSSDGLDKPSTYIYDGKNSRKTSIEMAYNLSYIFKAVG